MMPTVAIREVHKTLRFDPINVCIYCGLTEDLRDEHVIPFALYGNMILPKATCGLCAQITSEFERRVLRGFMFNARVAGSFPTRHPKNRPTSLPLTIVHRDQEEEVEVDRLLHPGLMHLPILGPPGVPSIADSVVGAETLGFGSDPETAARSQGAITIRNRDNWDLVSFGRMLAKIAYSYGISCIGVPDRNSVYLLPFLLGKTDSWGIWLGSQVYRLQVEDKRPLHALAHCWIPNPVNVSREILIVRVKLFAYLETTGYEVAVWEREVP